MLGFAPISTATLGGSGVARPVLNRVLTGVAATVSLGSISATANATISEIAIRKPDTTFFYDPNNDGIGTFRNDEYPFVNFAKYLILGFDPSLATTPNNSLAPTWSGTYPHAAKFGITATISDGPITYQGAHAPLVNGDYSFPATANDAGLALYQQPPHLRHLPETIASGAATIYSLADPLLANLTFPATDPGLFNVIIGQVQTLNTYDTTNTTTYFSDSLINASVAEITLPGENKSRELFHLFANKGFQIGPVSVGTFGTDKTSLTAGAAWVLYGVNLQPQITAPNFPDGTPVSQEHTFLVTGALGAITPLVTVNLTGLSMSASAGNVQPNIFANVDGLLIGTALTPDPAWYVNPSRVQLVAKANQSADSAVYPYLPGPFDSGPLQQDFDITLSLGALASPIGVDVPVSAVPTITAAIGQVTTRSFNTVPISPLPAVTTAIGNLEGEPTEIVSDSFGLAISLGTITTTSIANATTASFGFSVAFGSVTPIANANFEPSSFEFASSLGSLNLTADANFELHNFPIQINIGNVNKQVFSVNTGVTPMNPAKPNKCVFSPANSNFVNVARKINKSVIQQKITRVS